MSLENAILETLVYSDIFDYPLTIDELHRYLVALAVRDDVLQCLRKMDIVKTRDEYYFLLGRDEIVALRDSRELTSLRLYRRARAYGRILGKLPFIRMVALTGSLAVRNCDAACDYDYMLVTKPGRVWLARAFALVLNRIAHFFGDTLCPNLIVSENALEWSPRNLYTAREIYQMVLISGEEVYSRLRVANKWVEEYFPNIGETAAPDPIQITSVFQMIGEFLLGGRAGELLESWEMNRKISRFTRQAGYGLETEFNGEICQGNFGHHGKLTLEKYERRLCEYKLEAVNFTAAYVKDPAGYGIK